LAVIVRSLGLLSWSVTGFDPALQGRREQVEPFEKLIVVSDLSGLRADKRL
jgi:hypothetical protein